MPRTNERELVAALFQDGRSTRDQATETSGRGVGLSALAEVVRDLGGTIEVRSEPGRSTWDDVPVLRSRALVTGPSSIDPRAPRELSGAQSMLAAWRLRQHGDRSDYCAREHGLSCANCCTIQQHALDALSRSATPTRRHHNITLFVE
jgi:signal transduction histidine kinase